MEDLAVVSVDEPGGPRLRIYAFGDGTWARSLDAALRPGVLFVDVARSGGRDRLVTYERGRLSWFDPASAETLELVDVAASFDAGPAALQYAGAEPLVPADARGIPHVDVTRDLNRDGRDDLILPDVDGFWVSIQESDGSFTDPVRLGPPEPFRDEVATDETRTYRDVGISPLTVPWYLSRVHQLDWDRDGRNDLAFWNEDHFDVHRQDARGRFSPVAERFPVDVAFDSDGAYSILFGFSDKSTFSALVGFGKQDQQTVLCAVRDMNGDGVADLVTHSLEGRSRLKQRSRYEVHFGRPTPGSRGGIRFARDADTAVEPRGRSAAGELAGYSSLWIEDFDGDGEVDLLRYDVEIGVGAMIGALLGSSVSMDAELYGMEDGVYPEDATRDFETDFDIRRGGGGFFPAVLVGDVNGDGRSDVLVGKSREALHVFLGVPGPELLARDPLEVQARLPRDERNSRLVDLDRDGRQDVLLYHASTTGPQRVSLLIAR